MRIEQHSEFVDPAGDKGYVVQGWDPATATYFMVDALLTSTRWLMHDVPMVPGQGSPVFTYLTIRTMKLLGVEKSSIRRLVVGGNHHVESVIQLEQARRSGIAPTEAIAQTRSYLSVETPMIQSYHRVIGVTVLGGRRARLRELFDWHATGGSPRRREIARDRSPEHAELLARFRMTPDDEVLYDYETHLELKPW